MVPPFPIRNPPLHLIVWTLSAPVQRLAHPAGIVTIGAPFAGPASVNEKTIIRNEKIRFDR